MELASASVKPPPGFTLEKPAKSITPPPGFTLDSGEDEQAAPAPMAAPQPFQQNLNVSRTPLQPAQPPGILNTVKEWPGVIQRGEVGQQVNPIGSIAKGAASGIMRTAAGAEAIAGYTPMAYLANKLTGAEPLLSPERIQTAEQMIEKAVPTEPGMVDTAGRLVGGALPVVGAALASGGASLPVMAGIGAAQGVANADQTMLSQQQEGKVISAPQREFTRVGYGLIEGLVNAVTGAAGNQFEKQFAGEALKRLFADVGTNVAGAVAGQAAENKISGNPISEGLAPAAIGQALLGGGMMLPGLLKGKAPAETPKADTTRMMEVPDPIQARTELVESRTPREPAPSADAVAAENTDIIERQRANQAEVEQVERVIQGYSRPDTTAAPVRSESSSVPPQAPTASDATPQISTSELPPEQIATARETSAGTIAGEASSPEILPRTEQELRGMNRQQLQKTAKDLGVTYDSPSLTIPRNLDAQEQVRLEGMTDKQLWDAVREQGGRAGSRETNIRTLLGLGAEPKLVNPPIDANSITPPAEVAPSPDGLQSGREGQPPATTAGPLPDASISQPRGVGTSAAPDVLSKARQSRPSSPPASPETSVRPAEAVGLTSNTDSPGDQPSSKFTPVETRPPERINRGQVIIESSTPDARPENAVLDAPTPVSGEKKAVSTVAKTPDRAPTSARGIDLAKDREALGLSTLNSPERRTWREALDKAHNEGIPDNAMRIANEVNVEPRALSDVETAGLVTKAVQLKNQHAAAIEKVAKSTDPADVATNSAEARRIEQEFGVLSQALRSSGTEKGRALASQKLTLDADFKLLPTLARAKSAKGKELNLAERRRFETLTSQLEKTTQRVTDLERQVRDRMAGDTIVRVKSRRRMTPEQRNAEYGTLREKAMALLNAGCNN